MPKKLVPEYLKTDWVEVDDGSVESHFVPIEEMEHEGYVCILKIHKNLWGVRLVDPEGQSSTPWALFTKRVLAERYTGDRV